MISMQGCFTSSEQEQIMNASIDSKDVINDGAVSLALLIEAL